MPHTPTSDAVCQIYLDRISAGFDGYMRFSEATRAEQEVLQVFSTYGELLPESSAKLLHSLKMGPQDVFYDLGSGIGKLCAQAFLTTHVGRSVGIEVVHERHEAATTMGEQVRRDHPNAFSNGRSLEFFEANLLNFDFSDATVVYTCSTSFGKDLVVSIAELTRRCTNLRYYLSLRPTNFHLPLLQEVTAPCSWGKFTHCYVYGPKT
jgi:hypothetical protein